MNTRRDFLKRTAILAASPTLFVGCTRSEALPSYEAAVRKTWRHTTESSVDALAVRRELVRYATLAASSHNTQCWKFKIESNQISILPDFLRRCPAVDPDDHHLFVSLGCASENMVHAALANGLRADVQFSESGSELVNIILETTKPTTSALFDAIPKRQCTRTEYDGRPLSTHELKLLEQAGTGTGVTVMILTARGRLENVLDYVVQGNTAQVNDAAFVEELKDWIRFSENEAVITRDGLYTASSGNPTMPRWIGSLLFDWFFTAEGEKEKYTNQIRSSAGVAIFISERNEKNHWVEVGRCYERFALQATTLGIRNAFLNQPVEVSSLRPQFASYLDLGDLRPDLVVRFGRGPGMPRSLRRPIDAVIV